MRHYSGYAPWGCTASVARWILRGPPSSSLQDDLPSAASIFLSTFSRGFVLYFLSFLVFFSFRSHNMVKSGISFRSIAASLNCVVWLILLIECWNSAHARCFYPDGTEMHVNYTPCDNSNEHSMCCDLKRINPDPDQCRSDGLCFASWDQNVWRDGCTDRTWKSPACVKLCDYGLGKSTSSIVFQSRCANC